MIEADILSGLSYVAVLVGGMFLGAFYFWLYTIQVRKRRLFENGLCEKCFHKWEEYKINRN